MHKSIAQRFPIIYLTFRNSTFQKDIKKIPEINRALKPSTTGDNINNCNKRNYAVSSGDRQRRMEPVYSSARLVSKEHFQILFYHNCFQRVHEMGLRFVPMNCMERCSIRVWGPFRSRCNEWLYRDKLWICGWKVYSYFLLS